MIGAFRSIYRSKVSTCIIEYVGQYCLKRKKNVGQYCESKSVLFVSVDVVDELFVGCGKL